MLTFSVLKYVRSYQPMIGNIVAIERKLIAIYGLIIRSCVMLLVIARYPCMFSTN